jgi:hypothetical protein
MKAYEFPFYTIIGLFVEIHFEIYCKFCESQHFKKTYIIHTLIISIISNLICCFVVIFYFII